jgi:hypothetical protein
MVNCEAGTGKVCITPPIGLLMAGYSERNQLARGVHDDLYAKALVLNDGTTKLAVIATDLIGLDRELVAKIRQLAEERTGIKKANITVTASHTHSGPEVTRGYELFIPVEEKPIEGLSKKDYLDHLRDMVARWIAGAVYIANCNLEEAKIGVGKGAVYAVGLNRRDPKEPMDPEVGVVRVDNTNGDPIAILMNFTCHPTVLDYNNYLYSADYPGYAMRTVETALGKGVEAMFTNGACGNISTRFARREQTFREAERLGTILGGEVVRVASEIKTAEKAKLGVASKVVELPVKSFPTIEEAKRALEEEKEKYNNLKKKGSSHGELRVAYTSMEGAEIVLRWVEAGISKLKKIETEMQAIRIDDSVLVAEPGELFVEIALDIKKNSKLRNTFVVGYANDTIGYVPTKKAYEEGLYETFSTLLSPEAGKTIQDAALKLIEAVVSER